MNRTIANPHPTPHVHKAGRRFSAFLLLLFLLSLPAFAGPAISGNIDTLLFSSSSGPYIVEKDLVVPKEKTAIIPKGCTLLFTPFTGIKVEGTLIVLGAPDTPVVFTSISDSMYNPNRMRQSEPFDWNGILIDMESGASQLNHFILSYSTYGIKSQTTDLAVDNGIFHSNGQYHFTINDSIQYVNENRPFSYNSNGTVVFADPPPIEKPQIAPAPPPPVVQPHIRIIKSKPFRYIALGLGVAGSGVGLYSSYRANRCQSVLEDMSDGEIPPDKILWRREHELKWKYVAGSSVSFVGGAIGLAGLGIGFLF